jgi:hypothetical protein
MVPESYVWIVAPEMNLAEKEFRIVWNLAVRKGLIPVTGKSKRERWIEFENGSKIECRSAENPDQLIGEGVDLMIIAEAARLSPAIWEELLRPTLADRPGRAIMSSTPRGKNWFFNRFNDGLIHLDDEWTAFHVPSSANPLILRSEIERIDRLIEQDPIANAVLDQEWRANFITYKGVVFPEFQREVHVRREPYIPGQKTMLWVDPGSTNPYACLLVQITGDETVRVISEIYRTQKITDEIIKLAQAAWPYAMFDGGVPGNPPNPELEVVVDEAAAEAIAAWRLAGYRAWGAKPPLKTGIDVYHRMLRDPFRVADKTHENPVGIWPRITFDPSCEYSILEHNLYHYPDEARQRSEGGPTEVPVDADNHSISAIRYGLYALWPELFNEYHPQTEMVVTTLEEMGIEEQLDRMRIEAGYAPREYASSDDQWSLGDY